MGEDAERVVKELSQSAREPQLEPADHCYTVLQDYGPTGGGWGPATIMLPWLTEPRPFVYSGSDERVLAAVRQACQVMAQRTGMPTRLVRFTRREDVFVVGGAS